MIKPALFAVAILAAAPAMAQQKAAPPPERVTNLIVYGSDPCPQAKNPEEIVVCARQPEGERYRIPKKLRERPAGPGSNAWANRVNTMEVAGRAGLPNSCSVVGTGGQTGCSSNFMGQYFEAKRANEAQAEPWRD